MKISAQSFLHHQSQLEWATYELEEILILVTCTSRYRGIYVFSAETEFSECF
jgi:hypothetical protein